ALAGFPGLQNPQIVRGFAGSDHRHLLPLSMLTGGIFLIWADVIARVLLENTEIPIGVITSAVGAPIFVYMMVKKSYGFGGQNT
ncbi:MAG: iron chelate uptake ABC transporter family permease subunit, partial [Lachnospiraceae bacterium]|nr:iron chelate uptake ABC transporter family permease subunit [Lachnospiraceae bacterium]